MIDWHSKFVFHAFLCFSCVCFMQVSCMCMFGSCVVFCVFVYVLFVPPVLFFMSCRLLLCVDHFVLLCVFRLC